MSDYKKKLIEVALPLEAINRESAREKSIRYGHPSTLHLWWARRPLAACRAVLFSQLVDDPSARPDVFPTEEAQSAERQRLFGIIERLVAWDNVNDEALLREAHEEILKSTDGHPPAILDPFAGGGSIPLEAQRLGLEAHASDLNPVSVLINKALIEVPPKWAGQSPVFPGAAESTMTWPKASGLAEDVRRYGQWMRDEAEKRIGHLYPKAELPDGTQANVIAWVWCRSVRCPNPACNLDIPMVSSWWLSRKKDRLTWVEPKVSESGLSFEVCTGQGTPPQPTKSGRGSTFVCFSCGDVATESYVKQEASSGRMDIQMMATVAEGRRRRIYLVPDVRQESAAQVDKPEDVPDEALGFDPRSIWCPSYGLTSTAELFTARQLRMLTTFADLVTHAGDRAQLDALTSGLTPEQAEDYGRDIALYLALSVDRLTNRSSSLCVWDSSPAMEAVVQVFARQTLPMTWDFGEVNPFSRSTGNWTDCVAAVATNIERLPASIRGTATQSAAQSRDYRGFLVCTDPPYYDNINYSDLSDFFYVWLRRSVGHLFPELLGTVVTPKAEELVANVYRHEGDRNAAERFFEDGFLEVFSALRKVESSQCVTLFYAFRQQDKRSGASVSSSGWETLLAGLIGAGWCVTATWPVRTELTTNLKKSISALASSVVLALRPRSEDAATISRRGFVQALKAELPDRLRELQEGYIAPVDLAQAAIGPGMAVFSRYARVLEADGSDMAVRTALALINQALDEVLSEQEGDFDAETRFAVKWFSQFGWNEGASGEADVLSRAVNTTVSALERGGIFRAAAGKARLVEPTNMSEGWNPADDKDISVWEVAIRLGHSLMTDGLDHAALLMRESAARVDLDAVKELAYLMYSICERKGWADSAMLFNALGTSWGEVSGASRAAVRVPPSQRALDFGDDDE